MRRVLALISVAAAAAAVGVVVSPAAAKPAARSATIATFSDAVGEIPGAPDIGRVTVSLAGQVLTVEAKVAGRPDVLSDGAVLFWLNTDGNLATGTLRGAEYVLFMDMKTLQGAVLHWNGSDYIAAEKVADPSLTIIGGGTVGFEFNLANLGSPTHIEFVMAVLKGSVETGLLDVAPDSGLWAFDIPGAAPTPAPTPASAPTHALVPVIGGPVTTPHAVAAGRHITVTFLVTRSDNGQPLRSGRMICDPSVAGKVIRHGESFNAGTARLSFLVPKAAKGKLLKVKVTITTGNRATTRIATFRVR